MVCFFSFAKRLRQRSAACLKRVSPSKHSARALARRPAPDSLNFAGKRGGGLSRHCFDAVSCLTEGQREAGATLPDFSKNQTGRRDKETQKGRCKTKKAPAGFPTGYYFISSGLMKPVFQGACKHGLLSFCVVFAGLVAGSAGRAGAAMRPISQSCFSPVEMAALFSKPRKKTKGGSLSALRKERSALQRKIDLAEERLEDAKDRLADSLKVEGGRRGRSKAASNIESYIDREYDGWKCGKGIKGAALDDGAAGPLYAFLSSVRGQEAVDEAAPGETAEGGEIGEASVCRLKEKPRPSEGSGRNGQTLAAGDFRLTEKEPVGRRPQGFLFFSVFNAGKESEKKARAPFQTGGFSAEVKEKIGKGRRPNKRYSEKALLIERQDFRGKSASLILQERPLSGLDRASENGGFTQNGEASLPSPKEGKGWFSSAFLIKQTLKTSQAPLQWGDYLSGWIFPEAEAQTPIILEGINTQEGCEEEVKDNNTSRTTVYKALFENGECKEVPPAENISEEKICDNEKIEDCKCPNETEGLQTVTIDGVDWCRKPCTKAPKTRPVGATDCKCPNGLVESGQNCISKAQSTCEQSENGEWDLSKKKCVCKENQKVENCACNETDKPGFETWNKENKCVPVCPGEQERNGDTGQCVPTKQTKCTEAGHTWPEDKCICNPDKEIAADCECPGTHPVVWPKTGDPKQCLVECKPPKARIGDDPECKLKKCDPGDEIQSNGTKQCDCKSPNQEGDGAAANKCVDPEIKKPCKESGGEWKWNDDGKSGECTDCPNDKKPSEDEKKCICKGSLKKQGCECGAGLIEWKKNGVTHCRSVCKEPTPHRNETTGACMPCPKGQKENKDYQKDPAFEPDGKVDQDLCEEDRHGKDEKECKQALKDIKKLLKDLDKLRKQLDKKNEEISEKEFSLMESGASSDKKQESALCWDCVRDLRALNKRLSGSQLLGNILSVGLGVAGSLYGHKEAKRSQAATNELLALQGYPSESNLGYSLAGISLGVPFAARGLHGLVQGNSWRNSYQCSPTANPYGHYYRQPASYQYAPYRMY